MTEYVATTPGLYPLPDRSKDALSDLKGHQKHDLIDGTESGPVAETYADARAEVVERQEAAGLGRVVEGQLRWDDMLAHPLVVADAVEPRGLVRYYDNNNFYRDPVVVDALEPTGDMARELRATAELTTVPLQAVLPGPYSLADLATDRHYGDEAEFVAALGEFLVDETADWPAVETLFLLEPSLVTDPPDPDARDVVEAAIDAVAGAAEATVVVHTYWGGLDEPTHATLLDSAADGVGYDLITAPEASAELVSEHEPPDHVALGVVDGQNTLVESPGAIRDRVDRFEARLTGGAALGTAYVTANTELFYLPVSKFEAKLDALGDAVATEVAA